MRGILAVLALTIQTSLYSQTTTFTIISADSSGSGDAGTELIFDIYVRNMSASPLTMAFIRTSSSLPAGWSSSLCVGTQCLAPMVDSVATTSDFGFSPLKPGDTLLFSVHVATGQVSDTGTVHVSIRDLGSTLPPTMVLLQARVDPADAVPLSVVPAELRLEQNRPNPWNPTTRIPFSIARRGPVKIVLYDILGREVALLYEGVLAAGKYEIPVSAFPLASGTYLYSLFTERGRLTRTMQLLK